MALGLWFDLGARDRARSQRHSHSEPDYSFYKHGGTGASAAADRQEIGGRIHLERLSRHWTLADLSARTGIKIPNLSRLEKGKHVPSLETLEKVAGAFDLPVAALVSGRRTVANVIRPYLEALQ